MKFVHDAGKDLKIFMKAFAARKEQIAIARFGDGEERMYMGGTYHCSDGWVSRPNPKSRLRKALGKSIRYGHPNYYVGLRYPRGLRMFCWTLNAISTPAERLFDPCLFVNSRWDAARKFFIKERKRCFLVGSGKKVDYRIPANCIEPEYNWSKLLKKLLTVKKPILLAAGPLANVLVMEYLEAGGKQSIIDIGTVLDFELFGKSTRGYMKRAMAKRRKKKPAGKQPRKKKARAKAKPVKKGKRFSAEQIRQRAARRQKKARGKK